MTHVEIKCIAEIKVHYYPFLTDVALWPSNDDATLICVSNVFIIMHVIPLHLMYHDSTLMNGIHVTCIC